MKFIKDLNQFKKVYEAQASDYNTQLLEFKIIVKSVKDNNVIIDYAIFYDGKEFAKGNTTLTKGAIGYESNIIKLDNELYPLVGSLKVNVALNDAKQGAKLIAKIYQEGQSKTAIVNPELKLRIVNIEPFALKLESVFKPNEIVLDESKKSDVNKELTRLENYFRSGKKTLLKDGANIDFKLIGGASQISTTYQGGNEKLAQDRASKFKEYMINFYKENQIPELVEFVNTKMKVETVMGQTPYIDIKTKYAGKTDPVSVQSANKDKATNDANKAKYDSEQFISLELKYITTVSGGNVEPTNVKK